jgi:hypothetical protein
MPYQVPDISSLLLGIWGDIKTAKTSIALSAPKPIFHCDLDQGFDRAAPQYRNYNIEQIHEPLADYLTRTPVSQLPDIVTKPYQQPILFPGANTIGMIDIQTVVNADLGVAYANSAIRSCVIDTGSVMWAMATGAQLERAQIKNPNRQRISQIEYARPNQELRAIYGAARTFNTNLIITHHLGGIYQDVLSEKGVESLRVGDTWLGFNGMGAIVDMVARSGIVRDSGIPIPALQVETSGYTLALEGQTLNFPDVTMAIPEIMSMINTLRKNGQ